MNDLTSCVVYWYDPKQSKYTQRFSKVLPYKKAKQLAMNMAAEGCKTVLYELVFRDSWG